MVTMIDRFTNFIHSWMIEIGCGFLLLTALVIAFALALIKAKRSYCTFINC